VCYKTRHSAWERSRSPTSPEVATEPGGDGDYPQAVESIAHPLPERFGRVLAGGV